MKIQNVLLIVAGVIIVGLATLCIFNPRKVYIPQVIEKIVFKPSKPDTVYVEKIVKAPTQPDVVIRLDDEELPDLAGAEEVEEFKSIKTFEDSTANVKVKSVVEVLAPCPASKIGNTVTIDATKAVEQIRKEVQAQNKKNSRFWTGFGVGTGAALVGITAIILIK